MIVKSKVETMPYSIKSTKAGIELRLVKIRGGTKEYMYMLRVK